MDISKSLVTLVFFVFSSSSCFSHDITDAEVTPIHDEFLLQPVQPQTKTIRLKMELANP